MKVKKTKLPSGCTDAADCAALCTNILTKTGVDINAL